MRLDRPRSRRNIRRKIISKLEVPGIELTTLCTHTHTCVYVCIFRFCIYTASAPKE